MSAAPSTPEPLAESAPPVPGPVFPTRRTSRAAHPAQRWLWITGGLLLTGVGFVGLVVPGLPSTVFFILAAGCFSRGSDRLYDWLISLPHVGPAVRDYYAGLGMPRSAKIWATSIMLVCVSLGALAMPETWQVLLAFGATAVGAGCIWFYIPTRRPPAGPGRP